MSEAEQTPEQWCDAVRRGDRRALARAITLLESTRADRPNRSALATAVHHAAEACRLDPASGEAWAALGFISHQARDPERALAAARRATAGSGARFLRRTRGPGDWCP